MANKKHMKAKRGGAKMLRISDGKTTTIMPLGQYLVTAGKHAASAARKLKPGESATVRDDGTRYTLTRLDASPRASHRGRRSRGGRAARKLHNLRAKVRRSRKPAAETVAAAEIEYSEAKKNYHESGENLRALHEAEAKA